MSTTNSFILPAGTYVITDPCYVIERWDQAIEDTDCFDTPGVFQMDGYNYCGISTMYGDGMYYDNYGAEYPVDAGLIGAVSVELVILEGKCTDYKTVTFDYPVKCGVDSEGTIYFGDIRIETGSSNDYDDEEDEYFEEDDQFDED